MIALERLCDYIAEDPMRVFYFLGGSGGLAFWWDRWRNRQRLRGRIIEDGSDATGSDLTFEVENLGIQTISIDRQIVVTAWRLSFAGDRRRPTSTRETHDYFVVPGADRALPQGEPHTFRAQPVRMNGQPPKWFRTYRFRESRGRVLHIREPDQLGEPVSLARFLWLLFLVRLFGTFPKSRNGGNSLSDYRERKRRRGSE